MSKLPMISGRECIKSLTGDKLSNFSLASPENRYRTQANSRHCLWKLRKLSPVNPLASPKSILLALDIQEILQSLTLIFG